MKKDPLQKLVVKQNPDEPMPIEVLAESIKAISDGIKKLRSGPMNDSALILLIQHAAPHKGGRNGYSQISSTVIRAVLEGIQNLERAHLKPKPVK